MTKSWIVDQLNSHLMGSLLSGVHVPEIEHPLSVERKWQIWTELVFISICHQTNWDLLHNRIIEIASNDMFQLHPSRLRKMDRKQFNLLFTPGIDENRMRSGERTRILQCLGELAIEWIETGDVPLFKDVEMQLSGNHGTYHWLNQFPMFAEDPVQKKSRILIHQLLRYGLISVADPENIAPAVDYHLIRLYVRTARVRPVQTALIEQLKKGEGMRIGHVTALRCAVEEAMHYSAAGAGLRIDELNYIEWQIARSFCVRQQARCTLGPIPEKPIDKVVASLPSCKAGIGCPFVAECQGSYDSGLKQIAEPPTIKSYY